MAIITSANATNAIVKLVAVEALPALMGNLVMGNLVNRSYEDTLAKEGDTVNVAIPPVLTATAKTQGSNVTRQAVSLGNAQVVLNTQIEASFEIDDVTKALATPDLMKVYMQPAMIALAEKIETDLLAIYAQFNVNSTVGLAGTALTEAVVDSAESALFAAKVPKSSKKYLLVDAGGYSALRQIPRFSEYRTAQEVGLNALIQGELGRMKDLFIARSQFIAKTGSGPATTHNIAFADNAIALVTRKLAPAPAGLGVIQFNVEMGGFGMRVTLGYDKDALGLTGTVDCLYGIKVLRAAFGQQVES